MIGQIRRDIANLERLREVLSVLMRHGFSMLLEESRLKRFLPVRKRLRVLEEQSKEPRDKPSEIRAMLEELGPAFIKLGQLLSLRPDLLPMEYCEEFSKLQDRVRPNSFETMRRVLTGELKREIKEVFRAIEPQPVASASIAQVHRGILKSGEVVAVKIQKPQAERIMLRDLDIILFIARQVKRHYSLKTVDPLAIAEEFKKYSEAELDFEREGRNIAMFRKHHYSRRSVLIPKVYEKLTTKKLLVMEYMKGRKLSDIINDSTFSKEKKKRIASMLVRAILEQVFVHGVFHADPHPGNLLYNNGKIAFLDFGIVGFFDNETKEQAFSLFRGTILGDVGMICDALAEMNVVSASTDMRKLKEDLTYELGKFYDIGLARVNFKEAFNATLKVARENDVRIPSNLILLGKCVMTTEGVARELNPDFNIVKEGAPFLADIRKSRFFASSVKRSVAKSFFEIREFVTKLPRQTSEMLLRARDADVLIRSIEQDIERMTGEIDRSSNRIVLGLLITAFMISSALMAKVPQPQISGMPALTLAGLAGAGLLLLVLAKSVLSE